MARIHNTAGAYDIYVDVPTWNNSLRMETNDGYKVTVVYLSPKDSKKLRKALKAAEKQTGLK
jgi:hypothetical protein